MELAPIVVFSYNRPDHLRRTLEALAKNDLAGDSVLYVYCDGAKADATEEQRRQVAENRKVAHAATGFKEVHVVEREQNIGLKDNIIGAVTEIVNQYGRIITLEDDVVSSVGFLRYMNDALELYTDEERVMHVSAYFMRTSTICQRHFSTRCHILEEVGRHGNVHGSITMMIPKRYTIIGNHVGASSTSSAALRCKNSLRIIIRERHELGSSNGMQHF